MSKRLHKSLKDEPDIKSEFEDILAAPSIRPSLSFLGLEEKQVKPGSGVELDPTGVTAHGLIDKSPKPRAAALLHRESVATPEANVLPVPDRPRQGGENGTAPADSSSLHAVEAAKFTDKEIVVVDRLDTSGQTVDGLASAPDIAPSRNVSTAPTTGVSGRRIYKCSRAQDGHSHIEQEVYSVLWKYGTPEGEDRLCHIGFSLISREARVHKRNISVIVRRLIQKQSIEIVRSEAAAPAMARTYRVFCFSKILKRRKAVGLEWVSRRRGVEFVNPENGEPLFVHVSHSPRISTPDAVMPSGAALAGGEDDLTAAGGNGNTAPGPNAVTAPGPDGVTPPHIGSWFRNRLGKKQKETTTTVPDVGEARNEFSSTDNESVRQRVPDATEYVSRDLLEGLRRLVPTIDEQAVVMLWTECRSRATDCTPEEVLSFVKAKASIALNGKIQNPVGFLLRAVPKCFEGTAFVAYREEQRRRLDEEAKRRAREDERVKALEDEGREEAEAYEKGKKLLEKMSKSEYQALYERTRNELLTRFPNVLRSAPKTVDDLVQHEMITRLND